MAKTWNTISKDLLFSSPFFELYKEKCETFTGKTLDAYYRMELGDWVQVIAITKEDQCVLIRQYRHGSKDTQLEIVGGVVENGEDPQLAAVRELAEETGYASENWSLLAKTRPNPAIQNNYMYTYLALDAEKVSDQNLDPFEDIEVELYSQESLKELLFSGEITHSLVYMSLLKYYLTRK
jgi:8-oxo-dGTP pyrophosphatase MutT (NUDIX family)